MKVSSWTGVGATRERLRNVFGRGSPTSEPPGTGVRVIAAIGALVVLVVLGPIVNWWPPPTRPPALPPGIVLLARSGVSDDPSIVQLPSHEDRKALGHYLRGPGRPMVELHHQARRLLGPSAPSERTCFAVATDVQSKAGDPTTVFGQASEAPDAVTAELAVDEARSTSRVLGTCGDDDGGSRAELAYEWVLVERWIASVGVR